MLGLGADRCVRTGRKPSADGREHDVVLDRVRRHEHAHVRQYERWGLLFFPAYAGASLVAWLCARHPYWHNHFECQARREAGEERDA